MTTLFVTSSGTDIGKTYLCCSIIERLRSRMTIRCVKPVVSGFDSDNPKSSDTARLLAAQGRPVDDTAIAETSPWRFREPISADMAAAREGRQVPFAELIEFCRPRDPAELNLIEGIGGVMAPIDETHTVADWIAALETAPVLVVGSYLGSISHTLTAVAALRQKGFPPGAIVISQSLEEPVPTSETADCIRKHCPEVPLEILPRSNAERAGVSCARILEALRITD